MKKPVLAVTLGDAAGTGPELIAKAFGEMEVRKVCLPVVVGSAEVMREAVKIVRA